MAIQRKKCIEKKEPICYNGSVALGADLPDIGLVKMRDAETGHEMVVDTSSRKVRDAQYRWWSNLSLKLKDTFNRSNVDSVSIRTDQDYVSSLMTLFAQRG